MDNDREHAGQVGQINRIDAMKTDERVEALVALETLARWLAKKQVKEALKARGRRPLDIDPVELAKATNQYLTENRARLREEARIILNQV
jgi:hypothetical protein